MSQHPSEVPVWDRLVRVGHWLLVVAFFVAYLTEGEPEDVHVVAGYFVAAYVVARIIWGFVGSPHARFATFVRGPRAVLRYLEGLAKARPPHYVGHNPAGGAMIVALLLSLAATVTVGMMVLADRDNEGPLTPWFGQDRWAEADGSSVGAGRKDRHVTSMTDRSMRQTRDEEGAEEEERESAYAELHEVLANITLSLVLLHVLGVLVGSFMHRENLVRAMITGRKCIRVGSHDADRSETDEKPAD